MSRNTQNGSHGHARAGFALLVCAGLAFARPATIWSQPAAPSEYDVKAVWLLNFARFVDWPANAFSSPKAPFVVGVMGRDPFGASLEKTFAGKVVKGRPFVLKQLSTEEDAAGCHMVFFPTSERRRPRDWIQKMRRAPVLTVGEAGDFLSDGGVIQFIQKDETIRFAINLDAASSARLKVSANLLKVAVSVQGKYE